MSLTNDLEEVKFSMPQFPHWQKGYNNNSSLGLLCRLNGFIHEAEECLLKYPGAGTPQVLGGDLWLWRHRPAQAGPAALAHCPPQPLLADKQEGGGAAWVPHHPSQPCVWPQPSASTRRCGELGWCYSCHKPQPIANCPVVSCKHIYN